MAASRLLTASSWLLILVRMRVRGDFIWTVLAFVIPLAIYVKTLSPTYIPIDSAELALCFHFWGVCHPPGFPLLTFLGKIFVSLWPMGSVIYRANLFSAIWAAATILVVYLTLIRLGARQILALLVALFLAVNSAFWEFATASDVFSFGTFLMAITFYLVVAGRKNLAFLALGLASSHFYLTAVLWPALYLFFWGPKINFLKISAAALIFASGFFPQVLLYLRMQADPTINWGHAQGVLGFIHFARRKEFGSIFLLSNPALVFSVKKVIAHFSEYARELFLTFGVILPIVGLWGLTFGKLFKERVGLFLIASWLVLTLVQLFLLSTIDPGGEDSPFQISKFYLASYVLVILLLGLAFDRLMKKLFGEEGFLGVLMIGAMVAIFLAANFKSHDFSKNYFSQNIVVDALSQLPKESLAITVSHIFYFGGRYEQEINDKFEGVTLLYFPNEKNRDNQFYVPWVFKNQANEEFASQITKDKKLGQAEAYILDVIARNLDKPIYILQGTFEEQFFGYLKPYIRPYGLWWRVERNLDEPLDDKKLSESLSNLRNGEVKFASLGQKNQALDSLIYAVSYHSGGIALASGGQYEQAIELLSKSYQVRPKGDKITKEIELIRKVQTSEGKVEEWLGADELSKLMDLGSNYFTLNNFSACIRLFEKIIERNQKEALAFNNLASCQVATGRIEEARSNYRKALEIDQNLDLAKRGLEALER